MPVLQEGRGGAVVEVSGGGSCPVPVLGGARGRRGGGGCPIIEGGGSPAALKVGRGGSPAPEAEVEGGGSPVALEAEVGGPAAEEGRPAAPLEGRVCTLLAAKIMLLVLQSVV